MNEFDIYALEVKYKEQVLYRGIIENPPISIGRSKSADIAFEKFDFMSRKHLEIYVSGRDLCFRDLKSSNGITQDGKKIMGGQIDGNTKINIGLVTLSFKKIDRAKKTNSKDGGEKTITEISIHGTLNEAIQLVDIYENLKQSPGIIDNAPEDLEISVKSDPKKND